MPELPNLGNGEGLLNLFDKDNPDINLFNLIDEENIRLAGSQLLYYKYFQSEDYDEVYMESRVKPLATQPIVVWGHYEPQALTEKLGEFGIELENDQLFIFNKSAIERDIGRVPIPGDVVKPAFQNQRYDLFEVVEDEFGIYGVYHMICSAKLHRDTPKTQIDPMLKTPDELGGYAGE